MYYINDSITSITTILSQKPRHERQCGEDKGRGSHPLRSIVISVLKKWLTEMDQEPKWLSQLLQKVEANKLWSWGEAEKISKIENSVKKIKLWSKFTGRMCVPCMGPCY